MKVRSTRLSILLLILLLAAQRLNAEHLPVKVYTSADGLGSSFIDYLMRDSRGFMWFCTRDGLSRFDGSRFITYQIGDKDAPPGVESIFESSKGVYWISTTGGTYRFNPNILSTPRIAKNGRPILDAEYIFASRGNMVEDSRGNIWFAANGVYLLEEEDGKVVLKPIDLNLPGDLNHTYGVSAIYLGSDGSLWVNTSFGPVRRLPNGRVIFYASHAPLIEGVTAMMMDREGRVWLKQGLDFFVIKPESIESISTTSTTTIKELHATRTIPIEAEAEVTLPSQPGEILRIEGDSYFKQWALRMMYETSDGHVWITTEKDLFEYDGHVLHRYDSSQGFVTSMVRMAEDAAGNLWLAGQSGLVRLDRKGLVSYRESDGLRSSRVNSINRGTDGTLYLSIGDSLISKFDGKHFESVRLNTAASAKSIWTSRAGLLDSKGEWWAMTTEGLYRFAATNDIASLSTTAPLAIYTKRDGLKSNSIYQVFEDKRGDLWVSTRSVAGESSLARWSRAENKFYVFSEKENFPEDKSASAFAEDSHGNLWFGFYEGGLARFADGKFTVFGASDGFPGVVLTDLLVDHAGRLWLSSARGGLARADDPSAAHPRFIPYTTDNGLSSNNIRTITEDREGNLYLGTVRGVDRFNPETGYVKHYSVSDGLAADFVVDSTCDPSGTLWFATADGLSKLTPASGEKPTAPQIWLGGLRISGLLQPMSELGSGQIGPLELSHTQNNLQIDFFALDFHAGEKLHYQFQLEGADKDWSAPTEQRTVTFPNLQPGSYRFVVRAINSEGLISDQVASVTFKILPPIWLRWWFVLLVVVLLALILYLSYRFRLAHLKQVNAALADAKRAEEDLGKAREERITELEHVRIRIATDLHDDIGASLTQIAILSEVARQQSVKGNGASLEPLKSIATVSNELVETMSDIVWAINPKKDHLQDLIQRMRRFASDLLSAKGITFEFNVPQVAPEIPLGANPRREVFLIFKESLTNIVKHSGATHVRIDFDVSSESVTLRVSDNGMGFELSQVSAGLFSSDKGGHGILSMKKRAAEMHGQLEVKTREGKGTTIEFTLPLVRF